MALRNNTSGRPVGSLGRAMAKLTVSNVKAREVVHARSAATELREELHEFQTPIAGSANSIIAWQPISATFPYPMVPAPSQRDSELEVPQFMFGYHLYKSSAPVVLVGFVQEWIQDDSEYTTGADLQIGAYTPGVDDSTDYAGYVHLTFQGYSAPILDDDDSGA